MELYLRVNADYVTIHDHVVVHVRYQGKWHRHSHRETDRQTDRQTDSCALAIFREFGVDMRVYSTEIRFK